MPKARKVLNAFTADEVRKHTGISIHMINYLVRMDFLTPAYGHGTRGSVRYYSYRDLVVARIVQRLRDSGVQLTKLKEGIQKLSQTDDWLPSSDAKARRLKLLVTDGKEVYVITPKGLLVDLKGQGTFSFVVDMESVKQEIISKIPQQKLTYFTMAKRELKFERSPRETLTQRTGPRSRT